MPRVEIRDTFGMCYRIDTRDEATLKAWFDEVLPYCWTPGRPGIDDAEAYWPQIQVWPMWPWGEPVTPSTVPDWLQDTRVLGRLREFRAKDGAEGMTALAALRKELVRELAEWPETSRP